MKPYKAFLSLATGILLTCSAFAQQPQSAKQLIDEGIKLHDDGKFDLAIEKYKQALQTDPENATAMYEIANTLYILKNYDEALKHLDKLVKTHASGDAYSMLGNIYDDLKQPDKAIDFYTKGIKEFPDYQMLHFNLAIAYARQGKYPEANTTIMRALELDPSHASSHRLYAMISKQLGNDAATVMSCSNFLLLEPKSQRSLAVYNTLKTTIDSKFKRTGDKSINITLKTSKDQDPSIGALELGLSMAAVSTTLEKNQGKTQIDLLQEQLNTFYSIAGELSEKKKDKTFLWRFYADYFYSLAKSGNMPVFTRYISQSASNADDSNWLQNNDAEVKKLSAWFTETKHVTQ